MAETYREMSARIYREEKETVKALYLYAEENREAIQYQYDTIQDNTIRMIERLRHGRGKDSKNS